MYSGWYWFRAFVKATKPVGEWRHMSLLQLQGKTIFIVLFHNIYHIISLSRTTTNANKPFYCPVLCVPFWTASMPHSSCSVEDSPHWWTHQIARTPHLGYVSSKRPSNHAKIKFTLTRSDEGHTRDKQSLNENRIRINIYLRAYTFMHAYLESVYGQPMQRGLIFSRVGYIVEFGLAAVWHARHA